MCARDFLNFALNQVKIITNQHSRLKLDVNLSLIYHGTLSWDLPAKRSPVSRYCMVRTDN